MQGACPVGCVSTEYVIFNRIDIPICLSNKKHWIHLSVRLLNPDKTGFAMTHTGTEFVFSIYTQLISNTVNAGKGAKNPELK